jgi:hypothetical protein
MQNAELGIRDKNAECKMQNAELGIRGFIVKFSLKLTTNHCPLPTDH